MKPLDPWWYNRKKAVVFGKGHSDPSQSTSLSQGGRWKPVLGVCFFTLIHPTRGHIIMDENGKKYKTIAKVCKAIAKQYKMKGYEHRIQTLWQGSELGVVDKRELTKYKKKRR